MKGSKFKAGMSLRAIVPFSSEIMKVHIEYVLPSIYIDRKLIVYRVFGKHKRWWHEFLCTEEEMQWYIDKITVIKQRSKPNV
jgi:hypothetical protein